MEIFGPLILSLLAGLSTMIGSLFIYIKINNINNFIVFSLSFTISIMLCISLFDLIPNSVSYLLFIYNVGVGVLIIILIFVFGYLTIYIINIKNNSSLYKIGILSMISLMIHNFPEGILVFMGGYINIKYGFKLFLAILFHNIPEGIAISVPIYYSTSNKRVALLYTLISSLAEPLGGLIAFIFLKEYINNLLISYILLYISGLMISLSINEIYKEIKNYNLKNYSYLGYLFGFIIFILLNIID